MRLVLSQTDSARWQSGGQPQWDIEEALLTWAQAEEIREPIVVASADGQALFGFTVDGGDV
jgi:hypothetical protein